MSSEGQLPSFVSTGADGISGNASRPCVRMVSTAVGTTLLTGAVGALDDWIDWPSGATDWLGSVSCPLPSCLDDVAIRIRRGGQAGVIPVFVF